MRLYSAQLTGLCIGIIAASGYPASRDLNAQQSGKSSRIQGTVIEKSGAITSRQDRLDAGKSNRVRVLPEPTIPIEDEPSQTEIDPLDLLLPSDPHVDEKEQESVQKPRKTKRKTARKPANRRRPIDIALKNGKLVLNRFHTLKLDMVHNECREFPNILIADYKLPPKTIERLADNLTIVQKRICATNGSIMVTCYQSQATISLRRARPDDGCKR